MVRGGKKEGRIPEARNLENLSSLAQNNQTKTQEHRQDCQVKRTIKAPVPVF